MVLVNIVRSGGNDTYDMDLYLAHTAAEVAQSTQKQASSSSSASVSASASALNSISAEGEIGDTSLESLHAATASKLPSPNGVSVKGRVTGQYCINCEEEGEEEESSQQIVPAEDLSGALSFNQKGA